MPSWESFVVLAVVLTVVVVALARQTARILRGDQRSARTDDGSIRSETRQSSEPGQPATSERPDGPEFSTGALLANAAATQALVIAVLGGAVWYFAIPLEAIGLSERSPWRSAGVGLVLGVGLWLCNELFSRGADAAGLAYDERIRQLLAPESPLGWGVLFVVVLPLIAIAEELLFRAALIGVPAAGFALSPWLLVAPASIAFALGHSAQGRVGVVVTGVLGAALASAYVLTGSLLAVVVAHYVVNALEFLVHERHPTEL